MKQFIQKAGVRNHTFLFYIVHVLFPSVATLLFCSVSVLQVYFFQVNDFDFGLYLNLIWNIGIGKGWATSLYQDLYGMSFLGDHLVLGAALFAPLLQIWQSPFCLAVLHGLMTGLSLFILPWLVKAIVQSQNACDNYLKQALFVSLFLFVNKIFLAPWAFQTHMGTLFAPCVLLAVLALHKKWYALLVICCALLLVAQERSSVSVFSVGMYAFLLLRQRVLGMVLCVISAVYFVVAIKVVIPMMRGQSAYLYTKMIAPMFDAGKKARYVFWLFTASGGLPLFGGKALLASCCALPLIALNIVSERSPMYSVHFHYTDTISLFLAIASIYGIQAIVAWSAQRRLHTRFVWLGLALLLSVIAIADRKYSPMWKAYALLHSPQKNEYHLLNKELAPFITVPDTITVYTHKGLGPSFALRSERRDATPERVAQNLEKTLIVLSPVVGMWATDFPALLNSAKTNTSLQIVHNSPRLHVFATHDVAHLFQGHNCSAQE